MAIRQSIKELIGNTPLVQLNRYAAKRGLGANILAKIEYFNCLLYTSDAADD